MQSLESLLIKVLALKDLQKIPYNLLQWQFSLLTKSIIPNFRVLLAKRHLTHYSFCLFIIYCCCTLSLLNTLAEDYCSPKIMLTEDHACEDYCSVTTLHLIIFFFTSTIVMNTACNKILSYVCLTTF